MQNLPFTDFRGCEFCSLGNFQPSKSAKIHENQNSKPLIELKWQFFGPQKSVSLISRKV